jgi:hypothetical protein
MPLECGDSSPLSIWAWNLNPVWFTKHKASLNHYSSSAPKELQRLRFLESKLLGLGKVRFCFGLLTHFRVNDTPAVIGQGIVRV